MGIFVFETNFTRNISMDRITRAIESASQTKELLIGRGVIGEAGRVFSKYFSGRRAVIVTDYYTWQIAGNKLFESLHRADVAMDEPLIITDPDLQAEWSFVEKLDSFLNTTDAIVVAIGAGTINDICKLSSEHHDRRYMTVATAASMDGYSSFGASITKDGVKQKFACAAPTAIIADLDIICSAPSQMTAAGYADLFAKVPAGADWIIADELGIEPVDPLSFSIVQDDLADALGDPEGVRDGNPEAMEKLVEGLMLGGLAMQAYPKSSRPASGADHQFSHLWNMTHHVMTNGHAPSHGFQVSIGTLASLALYDRFMNTDASEVDIDRCVASWPSLEEAQRDAAEMFDGTDFPTIGVTVMTAKYLTSEELRSQLEMIVEHWDALKERLSHQLVPLEEAVARLKIVGAPVTPEEICLTRERLRSDIIKAQHLRKRFTILDLAVRTGLLEQWCDYIFGPDGIWPM